MRLRLLALVSVVACGPNDRSPALAVDASLDAKFACEDVDYVWADLTGNTPVGPLGPLHYMFASTTYCHDYTVHFSEHPRCSPTGYGQQLTLGFNAYAPLPAAGAIIPAGASMTLDAASTTGVTHDATFTVQSLDPVLPDPAGFAGRFLVSGDGWDLDINVATVAAFSVSCTL